MALTRRTRTAAHGASRRAERAPARVRHPRRRHHVAAMHGRGYRERRELIERIRHPVIYTPGDNEWLDCVDIAFRPVDPLERLASLRSTFFAPADRSLGEAPIPLETQSADADRAEFVEHARWLHGGVLFVTLHVVGGANGGRPFRARAAARRGSRAAHAGGARLAPRRLSRGRRDRRRRGRRRLSREPTDRAGRIRPRRYHAASRDPRRARDRVRQAGSRGSRRRAPVHVDRPFRDPATGRRSRTCSASRRSARRISAGSTSSSIRARRALPLRAKRHARLDVVVAGPRGRSAGGSLVCRCGTGQFSRNAAERSILDAFRAGR